MAKADVLTLVATLANDTSNATTVDDYYDDVIEEIGRGALPGVLSITDASFVAVTADTPTYTLPTDAVRPLLIVYDDAQLGEDTAQQAADVNAYWRIERGRPLAYVRTDEPVRTIALVPTPDQTGADITGLTPFDNSGFPRGNLTVVYTDRGPDFAADEELAIALLIASREFRRDSDHCDTGFADMAAKLGEFLLKAVHTPNPCGAR